MNVLFFHTPHPRLNLISQIELEVILGHLQQGDTVHVVRCAHGQTLGRCVTNHQGRGYYCYTCTKTQDKMYQIARKYGNLVLHDYTPKQPTSDLPTFTTIGELQQYRYKGVNVGGGAASVVISLLRDHGFDPIKKRAMVVKELALMRQVVDTLEVLSVQIKPDMVYVFNGRMSQYAAVVQWCRTHEQPFRVYEFTSRREQYHVVHNTIPHDVDYEAADIEKYWNNPQVSLEEKTAIGSEFYENTRRGIAMLEESFVTAQKTGALPPFDPDKEVITFFNSSIDEYAAVPGWEEYVYLFEDETDAIYQICTHYKNDPTKQFVLRIHPNLKYLNNTQTRKLKRLDALDNLIIVPATSPVSSYTLLDRSDKVITFGSTLGIEATYFGKASILLGLCFFRDLDAAYTPTDKAELYRWIDDRWLSAKPQTNAIKYGYWWVSFGEWFAHRDQSYRLEELELTPAEKIGVVLRKIGSTEIPQRAYKLFSPATYRKLTDKRFRQALAKEFMPWNKR